MGLTIGKFILEGEKVVPCDDLFEWGQWLEKADRRVCRTEKNGVKISTVFLGLDHSFGAGDIKVFETLVFGGEFDGDMERYSTWDEAEQGHKTMCDKVLK